MNLSLLRRPWFLAILLGAGLVGSPARAASDRVKFRNRPTMPEPTQAPASSDLLEPAKRSEPVQRPEPAPPSEPVIQPSNPPTLPPVIAPAKTSGSVTPPSTNPPIPPSIDGARASEEIVELNPQDKLIFSIREDPIRGTTPEEVHVNAQGDLQFRVSRGADDTVTINVRNKTLAAVERELKAKLEADYYQKVTIDLRVKEQTKKVGQVLFTGAVRGNFIQLLPGETKTIFEGVYQVGISEFANLKKVKLNRVNPQTRETESRVIDLESVRKGDRSKDVSLQDGDRVEVPEKSIVF